MAELHIYTTEGVCLHPTDGQDDPSINQYFEGVNFTVDLRGTPPTLEAYFRAILPSGRPEQLFLRFRGDARDTLFDDCRAAIQQELVRDRGWTIRDPDDPTDASMLLERAVLDPAPAPAAVLQNSGLTVSREALRAALEGVERTVELTGRNYEVIADVIRALADCRAVIAVVDGEFSLPTADLVIRQRTQSRDLTVPIETQRILQETEAADPPAPETVHTAMDQIEAQLEALDSEGVPAARVRDALDETVTHVYPELTVEDDGPTSSTARAAATESPAATRAGGEAADTGDPTVAGDRPTRQRASRRDDSGGAMARLGRSIVGALGRLVPSGVGTLLRRASLGRVAVLVVSVGIAFVVLSGGLPVAFESPTAGDTTTASPTGSPSPTPTSTRTATPAPVNAVSRQTPVNISSNSTYYIGQQLRYRDTDNANASIYLATANQTVRNQTLDTDGTVTFETAGLGAAQYAVAANDSFIIVAENGSRIGTGSFNRSAFQLVSQTITASFNASSVVVSERTNLTLRSANRVGYAVVITGTRNNESLTEAELAAIFNRTDSVTDGQLALQVSGASLRQPARFNDTGTYRFTVTAVDTTATVTAVVNVTANSTTATATPTPTRGYRHPVDVRRVKSWPDQRADSSCCGVLDARRSGVASVFAGN